MAIIVVGALLIIVASPDTEAVAASPTTSDHWHAAYGIYVCDAFLPAVADGPTDEPGRRKVDRVPLQRLRRILADAIAVQEPVPDLGRGHHHERVDDEVVVGVFGAGALKRQLVGPGLVGRGPAKLVRALLNRRPVIGLDRVRAGRAGGIENDRFAGMTANAASR